jgi:hypothetical protein
MHSLQTLNAINKAKTAYYDQLKELAREVADSYETLNGYEYYSVRKVEDLLLFIRGESND